MINLSHDLTIRVGCHLVYETAQPTPILLLVRPRISRQQRVDEERMALNGMVLADPTEDAFGNRVDQVMLQPGQNIIHHDARVAVSSQPDNFGQKHRAMPTGELNPSLLRYTLPSRYCDSDKLLTFASQQFGHIFNGLDQVYAICNWVHSHIEYRFGSGSPDLSASEIIARRYGVCRDFAHAAIALCRALNLPARYVSGHLPDIGWEDPGTPMDFHAYFEVYLDHQWCIFDARFNAPRIGRVKVAHGLDAVDVAFGTLFGAAQLIYFEAWAYQVNPFEVHVDDPIDLSKRLDGHVEICVV